MADQDRSGQSSARTENERAVEMQQPQQQQPAGEPPVLDRQPSVGAHLPSQNSAASTSSSSYSTSSLPLAHAAGDNPTASENSINQSTTELPAHTLPITARIEKPLPMPMSTTNATDGSLQIWLNNSRANLAQGFSSNEIRTSRYSWWNFLPLNLFEQFRRFANLYFLVITVMQGIPAISPFPIYTSLVPFVFILSVSAIKDGWEDIGRHRADAHANGRTYTVLMEAGEKATAADHTPRKHPRKAEISRPGSAVVSTSDLQLRAASTPSRKRHRRSRIDMQEELECFHPVTSKHIRVGQVLRIKRNEEFPADLLFLSSSNNDATAFVNTANLDGEAVPKIRSTPLATCELISPSSISALRGSVVVEKPTASMYRFQGRLQLDEQWVEEQRQLDARLGQPVEAGVWRGAKLVDGFYQCPLGDTQLLLRGSKLVNTSWVYGIVVYSGPQSKLMLNRSPAKFKFSKFEKTLNGFVIQLFIFNLLICLILAAIYVLRDQSFGEFWLIAPSEKGSGWILNALTQYILFSFMIPMSLIVTIELVKVGQSLFMESANCDSALASPLVWSARCDKIAILERWRHAHMDSS